MDEGRAPGRGMALRCARALGVSSLAWASASAAHALAGGSPPGAAGMVGLVLFAAWPLIAVLGGVPSRVRMVLVLLAAQGLMHGLMELFGRSTAGSSRTSALPAGGHHGHGSAGPATADRAPTAAEPLPHASGGHSLELLPSPAMICVHLVAALLLGLVLVHSEGLLRSALDLLAAVLLPIAAVTRSILAALGAAASSSRERGRVQPARVASVRPDRHVLDVVARGVVRRGPPSFA